MNLRPVVGVTHSQPSGGVMQSQVEQLLPLMSKQP